MEVTIIMSFNRTSNRHFWKDSFRHYYYKTHSSPPFPPSPPFFSLSVIYELFVFVFCRGWGHIPCRIAWIRADRPGNHRPFRPLISAPSCTVTNSSKALGVYLTIARCPSVWDCPEFYCLVLFTVLTVHTMALCWSETR